MQPWDGIDWASLEHNYGSAADIPRLLQRCTSTDADDVAEAISELDNALHHQGGWIGSASSAALPFLLDLAASATHYRAAFVHLVWDHCRTWQTADEKWIDPAWPAAVRSVEPRVRAVVAVHDPRVRRPAIHVAAGLLETQAAETLLIGLWETELDQATRIDLIDALSVVLKRDPERARARSVLEETAAGSDAQLSIAALLELPDATDRAVRLVVAAQSLIDMDAGPWKEAAAYDVGVGGVLSAIMNAVLPDQANYLELLETFLASEPREIVPDELAQRALEGCGRLLSRRRDAADQVAPLIAPYLASPDPGVRYMACYLLACTGDAARPYADEIALLLQDRAVDEERHARRVVAAAAIWAMARIGDPRCLPYVRDELEGRTNLFPATKHSSGGSYFMVWEIGIDDLVRPLHAYADALLADVLRAMARNERSSLTLRLAEVLQDWDIRGKVPAGVVDLLKDDEKWRHAALAIGSLGEVVLGQRRRAARLLVRRAEQDDGLAAWAHRRLTGRDVFGDQTLSRVLDAAITTRHATVSLSDRVLPYVATRPPATGSDVVRLRKLLDSSDAVRPTAAAALCLLHGGTEQGDILVKVARQNHWAWRILAIVLNEVRDAPAAQETFGPIARELIEDRNRVGTDVGWAAIARDESLTARASRFLA